MRGKEHRGEVRESCTSVISDLESLLLSVLPHAPSNNQFHQFKCPLCNDYKVRAGIRFDHDHIGYNCFNCGKAGRYEAGNCSIHPVLLDVFERFGGAKHDINMLKWKLMSDVKDKPYIEPEVLVDGINVFKSPPVMQIPPEIVTLEEGLEAGEPQAIEVAKYLISNRQLLLDPSTVMVAITNNANNPWRSRLIFPIVMWRKTVGLAGRDITGRAKEKYYTKCEKSKAIFNHDVMAKHKDRPLFIFEGQMDALRMDGIAVFGNNISPHQKHWIDACERRKVFVPDKGKSGLRAALMAVDNGWSLALPDIGSHKDVDEAVVKYGKLYCLDQLLSTIVDGDIARTKAQLYCKGTT